VTAQAFPVTFANLPGGNNSAALLDQNFAVCVRGPTPTVVGTVPYWDNTGGTSLNAGLTTNPGFGTITALIGLDGSSRLPAVNGSLLTNIPSGLIRSYLAGMTLSNDGVTPNTILDISAGVAADSTNAVMINSASAFTKSTGGAWTSGTGNNGMGLGLTIANNTWYHTHAINNGGVADFYFDTSAAAANKPVGTTAFRRIGSFLTDGAAHIIAFHQLGDLFTWDVPVNDVNGANPGTAAVTRTLTVPTGVVVQAWFTDNESNASTSRQILWTSLDQIDSVPTATLLSLNATNAAVGGFSGDFYVKTNTSAQIRYRSSASGGSDTTVVSTKGWIDSRGRNN
jgi:hypothetical protein